MKSSKHIRVFSMSLLSLAIAATATGVQAQTDDSQLDEIVVTGYKGSLLNSTNAKRQSVGFTDEVFADDIGKMPSQNLAESLARIPGVKINREVTGEGQQISVRGLGPAFTKVVMNGNSIAVASDGSLGSGQRGRHIDLDMFPSELFKSLSVSKTTTAGQSEGGVSGYVDMRTLRASDMGEGSNFRLGLESAYNEMSKSHNPKISGLWGHSTDKWGVLLGVVHRQSESRVDGYETVGNYQDGCLADPIAAACNPGSTGANTFHFTDIASADYAAAHPGVSVGDQIDINAVSGLTDEQLDSFGIPYIGRPMYTFGDRDSTSAILALEFKPNEDMLFALDYLRAEADRSFLRNELSHFWRRNYAQFGTAWIPSDIQLNSENALVSGTFYNARAWVGSRIYDENLTYQSIMPSFSWQIHDELQLKASYAQTDSEFERDEPYLLYYAPAGTLTVDYTKDFPTVQFSNLDVARASDAWTYDAVGSQTLGGAFRFQRNYRETETSSFKVDVGVGENPDINGFKFGIALEEITANMLGFDSTGFSDLVNNSDLAENFGNYLADSPVTDLGGSVSGYNGVNGIASINWDAVKQAIGYDNFNPGISTGGDQFGQTVGNISEEMLALYAEANSEAEVAGRTLRTNLGVRLVSTEQVVSTLTASTTADYDKILPSLNAVYDVTDSIKIRASASRSFTRPNPSSMFPEVAWNGSGIDNIRAGNPFLRPFESTNFDIGGEWYFNDLCYVGFTYYEKDITGFTRREDVQVQFEQLANYGVDISDTAIGADRVIALQNCGGRSSSGCMTNVSTDVNINGNVTLSGYEVIWVMPLDFLVEGLGFNTSFNSIDQDASDPESTIFGINDTFNFTAYYENERFQTRVTYYKTDKVESNDAWSPTYSPARTQIDLAASYNLPILEDYNITLTFDAYNLTNEPLQTKFESDGQAANIRYPGATYTFGIRSQF